MNEAETRAEHIDPALKAAGWGVVEGSQVRREFGITQGRLQGHGQRARAEVADYVLVYRNIKLAVVEAKAWDLGFLPMDVKSLSFENQKSCRLFKYSIHNASFEEKRSYKLALATADSFMI